MTARLDHLTVPSRDRVAAARLLGTLLGVRWAEQDRYGLFSPVYVSDELTVDFDQWNEPVPRLHYAFRVSDAAFDATLARLRAAGIPFRSTPHGADDGRVNESFGGRLVYWNAPDDHVWEVLTVSYAREQAPPGGG